MTRMSALLDDPASDAEAVGHLDVCDGCRSRLEHMRRTRMALSAMSDLSPPPEQWRAIEAELEARGLVAVGDASNGADGGAPAGNGSTGEEGAGSRGNGAGGFGLWHLFSSQAVWLRAAAAVLLFTGGMVLGPRVTVPWSAGSDAGTSAMDNRLPEDRPGRLASAGSESGELDYEQWLRRLEKLRASGPTPEEAVRNPEAAAEHLARLDALIQGARDYVREMPADARLNDFLFEVVEDRQALNDALKLVSLEYR